MRRARLRIKSPDDKFANTLRAYLMEDGAESVLAIGPWVHPGAAAKGRSYLERLYEEAKRAAEKEAA